MTTNLEEIPAQASYVLNAGLVAWVRETARREGKSASEFVRDLLEAARKSEPVVIEPETAEAVA